MIAHSLIPSHLHTGIGGASDGSVEHSRSKRSQSAGSTFKPHSLNPSLLWSTLTRHVPRRMLKRGSEFRLLGWRSLSSSVSVIFITG